MGKRKGGAVRMACKGAETRSLEELENFQGDLKHLTSANQARLRRGILELGFSEPIRVWGHEGRCCVLNGHQRLQVLRGLAEEGFEIPPIPVSLVQAHTVAEAKLKVLALVSQYAEVTEQGLADFLADAEISSKELEEQFQFPEIDLESFVMRFGPEREFEPDEGGFARLDHRSAVKCPRCGHEFTP